MSRKKHVGWRWRHGKKWSETDIASLLEMRLKSKNWDYIAAALKRSKASCQLQYHYATHGRHHINREQVRMARRVPLQPRTDLTGIICGDPAPGRSALEQPPRRKRPISLAPVLTGASA